MKRSFFILLACTFLFSSCGIFLQKKAPYYSAGTPWDEMKLDGRMEVVWHKTTVDGPTQRRMLVYLPPGYDSTDTRYPVVYLLHGARGHESSWVVRGRVLQLTDSLIRNGLAEPYILVLPNVNQYDDDKDFDNSRYKDSFESILEHDGAVETGFCHDVVGTVDSLFRTIPDKAHRCLAGLSSGGLKTIYISAKNPDMFGYVGCFSPYMVTVQKKSDYNSFYHQLYPALDRQFGDDPPLEYWLMVGRTDFLIPHVRHYNRHLNRKGYPHEYIVSKGSHDWYNWRDYYVMLMQRVFR